MTNASSAMQKVISEFSFCRRYNGRAVEQNMADLPSERILPDLPSFTNSIWASRSIWEETTEAVSVYCRSFLEKMGLGQGSKGFS